LATGTAPTLREIEEARVRLEGHARVTPVFSSETFSRLTGRSVVLKAENLQRTGAFKIRGAVNRISSLPVEHRSTGVVTASAGNHGQALAWAAREFGTPATIFMPQDSPMAKVDATRNYGARVELAGSSFEEALAASLEFSDETGATYVHAFEDELVIAGQGTIGIEIAEQIEQLETLVVPIGGGGLASGIALALRELRPEVKLVGVQAETCVGPDATGLTIAEGIAVKHPGQLTMSILEDRLDEWVTVGDDEISQAIVLCLERAKLTVEGAGAAALAAVLAGKVAGEGPVCALLSGGNIDATLLISVMRQGLTQAGRYLVLRTRIPDRPGELIKLLTLVAQERVNVVSIEHHREGMDVPVGETEVELTLATRDRAHCTSVLDAMAEWGYAAEPLR
jgi:threonine dehydratase